MTRLAAYSGLALAASAALVAVGMKMARDHPKTDVVVKPASPIPSTTEPADPARRAAEHITRGEFEAAARAAEEWAAALPGDAGPYLARAEARIGLDDLRGAEADLMTAARLAPAGSAAAVRVQERFADVYGRTGRPAEAVAAYTSVLAQRPDDYRILNARGWSYLELGQLDRAVGDFGRLVALRPEAGIGYLNRGRATLAMGRAAAALPDLNRAVELLTRSDDPDDRAQLAVAYLHRGRAHDRLGDRARSQTDRAKATSINPSVAEYGINPAELRPLAAGP